MKKYEDIPGWCDSEITDIYDRAIDLATHGSVFVEIGSFEGKSTSYMLDKIIKSGKKIHFFVIDLWDWDWDFEKNVELERDIYEKFLSNMGDRISYENLHLIRADSIEASGGFRDETIDFIFFDGAHDYEKISAEIDAWLPKTKKDALVAGHDPSFPGIRQAVSEKFQDFTIIESTTEFSTSNFSYRLSSWIAK